MALIQRAAGAIVGDEILLEDWEIKQNKDSGDSFEINNNASNAISIANSTKKVTIANDLEVDGEIQVGNINLNVNTISSSTLMRMRAASGQDLLFDTNGSNEKMRILSNGNVGINETNPTYKLDVDGTARFTGTITGNLTGDASGSSSSCSGNAATATLASTTTITDKADNVNYDVVFGDSVSALYDDTGTLTYNPSTATLSATNFVGAVATATLASTTTITDKADNVNYDVVFGDSVSALYDDTGTLTYNPSTATLSATNFVGAVATATLASTTTITDKADNVNYDVVFGDSVSALYDDTGTLTYNPSTATLSATNFVGAVATATLASTTTITDKADNVNYDIVFGDSTSALYDDTGALTYNPSTGNLGIGIDAPGSLLHIHHAKTSTGLDEILRLGWGDQSYDTGAGDGIKISFYVNNTNNTASNEEGAYIGVVKQSGTEGNTASELVFATKTNAGSITEQMRIADDGNVGIGTNAPSYELHVDGQGKFEENVGIGRNPLSNTMLALKSNNISGFDTLTIEEESGFGVPSIKFINSASDTAHISLTASSGHLRFKTDDTERMRIKSGGNVGIGTDDPSKKLEVDGTFNCTGNDGFSGNICAFVAEISETNPTNGTNFCYGNGSHNHHGPTMPSDGKLVSMTLSSQTDGACKVELYINNVASGVILTMGDGSTNVKFAYRYLDTTNFDVGDRVQIRYKEYTGGTITSPIASFFVKFD